MIRSLLERLDLPESWELFPGRSPVTGVAATVSTVRIIGLAIVVTTVVTGQHPPGLAGRGLAVTVSLALSVLGYLTWTLAGHRVPAVFTAVVTMAVAGGVLAAVSPVSGALVIPALAAMTAGANAGADVSFGVTAAAVAAFLTAALVTGGTAAGLVVGFSATIVGLWSMGLTRRGYVVRAGQAEKLVAETRRAASAEAEAARISERTRIARDIHDVLAHSLAAVAVNLEAAAGLLSSAPADIPEVAKALECVNRAAGLTRDGLGDAKRAVHALRDAAPPLPSRLADLASQFSAAGDATAGFSVTGTPRPVSGPAGLTVYRAAQEALTNARKHAPGQPVAMTLSYPASDGPGDLELSVESPLPPRGGAAPLSVTGGGYGLDGLRERAGEAGGTLDAGPADGRWRVCLRIPA